MDDATVRRGGWRMMRRALRPSRGWIAVGVLTALGWTVAKVTIPLLAQRAVDEGIDPYDRDALLRGLKGAMRSVLSAQYDLGGSFSYLSQIGIEMTTAGTMRLSQSKFNDAVSGGTDQVALLLAGTATEDGAFVALQDMLEQHLLGPAAFVRAVLPVMRAAGSGSIVQMSSQGGRISFPAVGSYSAGKFALEGWSEALSAEVAPFGIRVLIVEPSRFRTEFNAPGVLLTADARADYESVAGALPGANRTSPRGRPGWKSGPDCDPASSRPGDWHAGTPQSVEG